MTSLIKKIWENKVLSLFVLALILICSFYGCKSVIAHADESNEPESNEVAWTSDEEADENSNELAPMEAYGYKDEGCAETVLVLRYDRLKQKEAKWRHVYDIPTSATQASDWPWDNERSEFTRVIIDDSLNVYSGLTSTAYMFYNFKCIDEQEQDRFKNLNTSNVTNMSNMFCNYAYDSPSINTTPDMSSWDTSKVTDVSNMFTNYCKRCVIPLFDLSNFDTNRVSNSTKMLEGMKINSITLGSNFNLNLTSSGACLTNGSGSSDAAWYDKLNKKYENCEIGTISRTAPTVYFGERKEAYAYKDTTTWGGSGALVLTYDNEKLLHSLARQTIYNMTTCATSEESWEWNNDKGSFFKIKINENFKSFDGFYSTAYMFSHFENIIYNEGFENINTSHVTDMSSMFRYYGKCSRNLEEVPDVSKWDTSNVTNMSYMFVNFGDSTLSFNQVPDVSKWNTSKVNDMSNMFECYCCSSETLELVPDVSNWDTSNVTTMSYMFHEYGRSCKTLNIAPNVSKWNTPRLTVTKNMFECYGNSSTISNLDLSNWDTRNIDDSENYNDMFRDMKLRSITLGPNFDLDLTGHVWFLLHIACLTNRNGEYDADWYSADGYCWIHCRMGKVKRTAPTTYYDRSLEPYAYMDNITRGKQKTLVLTYDVDKEWHKSHGHIVYELAQSASQPGDWQWNNDRDYFNKVQINDIFKYYSGPSSTAFMFSDFTNVFESQGFENINTSNVTNMSHMFCNYGGSVENLNFVPNISNWDTSKVKDMSSTFECYGHTSETLNVVPDVSKWNTELVNDMSHMFNVYGASSTVLNAVPNVSNYNIVEVTDMSYMFSSYGYRSKVLNYVPDVSNWRTLRVKNMSYMFDNYACESRTLNVVPDVSHFDTLKVEDLSYMFSEYGLNSEQLSLLPNIGGWRSHYGLKDVSFMLYRYGFYHCTFDNLNLKNFYALKETKCEGMLRFLKLKSITLNWVFNTNISLVGHLGANLTNSEGKWRATWWDDEGNEYKECNFNPLGKKEYEFKTFYDHNPKAGNSVTSSKNAKTQKSTIDVAKSHNVLKNTVLVPSIKHDKPTYTDNKAKDNLLDKRRLVVPNIKI